MPTKKRWGRCDGKGPCWCEDIHTGRPLRAMKHHAGGEAHHKECERKPD